jgi:tetratricopeptide (TPR) repeat protein
MSDFDEVQALVKLKDIRSALALLDRIDTTRGPSPRSLVLRGVCLQLSDDANLDAVEATFTTALSMDDTFVDAYLELGWFYLMVMGKAEKAKLLFKEAASLLAELNERAIEGLLTCDEELNAGSSPEEARAGYYDLLIRGRAREPRQGEESA